MHEVPLLQLISKLVQFGARKQKCKGTLNSSSATDLLGDCKEDLIEEVAESISAVDREALKMLFAEVVDLSVPLQNNQSFCTEVISPTLDKSQLASGENKSSFTHAENRKEEVLAKIKRVREERKRRFSTKLENSKKLNDSQNSSSHDLMNESKTNIETV